MKRKYVAALLALSMSLTGITIPIEQCFSTEVTEIVESSEMVEAAEISESPEMVETTEIEEIMETTKDISEISEVTDVMGMLEVVETSEISEASETDNNAEEIVNIPDEVLRSAIIRGCDSDGDGNITKAEMETLTYLWVSSYYEEVSDLTGLEYAINLERLDAGNGNITNIEALAGLKKLKWINLSSNQISDISALANLENLEQLWLSDNQISDISILENLKKLDDIDLRNNQIDDIGILYNLKNLIDVRLSNNPINDLSVLYELKKLRYLYLDGNSISDISMLENFKELRFVSLANNQISDIGVLSELEYLYGFNLENNQISDISVLAGMKQLDTIELGNNQITDISAITNLENLQRVNFKNNQITEIPIFTSCFCLQSLYLEGNPLQNIKNAKSLLDVQVPYGGIDITASPEYVTPEMQFDNFFDTSERKMYVGNQTKLAVKKSYLRTGESVEIIYESGNTDLLSIDTEGWMSAKNTGTVNVTAVCGDVQKTFMVHILEKEEAVGETKEIVSTVSADNYGYGTGSILDEKNLLWSINSNNGSEKSEYVGSSVKTYIANVVYSKDRLSWWNDYVVLDENHTLYKYNKSDEEADYVKAIIEEGVTEFQTDYWDCIYYLTESGNLYVSESDGKKRMIAENVKSYYLDYSDSYGKVFTNNGDVVYGEENTVYSNLGTDCVFSPYDSGFLVLNEGTAKYYDYKGQVQAYIEDVAEIGAQRYDYAPFYIVQHDGTNLALHHGSEGYYWKSYDSISFPIMQRVNKNGNTYVLDSIDTLWCLDTNEKIAEDVTYLDSYRYLSNQMLYSMSDNSVILMDVKEAFFYYSDMTYYLDTDGIVWEIIDSERKNQILDSVVDIVETESSIYMVREDGTVWKYCNYRDNISVPYMVKDADAVIMGDISGDGEVKINDMLTILHGISGSQTLDASQQLAADIDKDGKVTVRDMLRVMHYISGASSTL